MKTIGNELVRRDITSHDPGGYGGGHQIQYERADMVVRLRHVRAAMQQRSQVGAVICRANASRNERICC